MPARSVRLAEEVRVKRWRSFVWLSIVLLALPFSADTADDEQQTENQIRPVGGLTFIDEYELTIANLVVYVTDKKGKAITDLTADDFEVFQDGDPKQITNFKLYTDEIIRTELAAQPDELMPLATPTPTSDDAAGPVPVHMVLYIDNQNSDPLDRNRVLSQTREFIRSSLHPPAQMMVVAYQRSFEVLQPFHLRPQQGDGRDAERAPLHRRAHRTLTAPERTSSTASNRSRTRIGPAPVVLTLVLTSGGNGTRRIN